jgi:hypothetical protein
MVIQFFDKDQGSLAVHVPVSSEISAVRRRLVEININGERFQVPLNDLQNALRCLNKSNVG